MVNTFVFAKQLLGQKHRFSQGLSRRYWPTCEKDQWCAREDACAYWRLQWSNIPLRKSHICTGLHGITINSTVSVVSFTPSMNMSPGKITLKSLTSIRKQITRSWLRAAGALRLLSSRGMEERKEDASEWLFKRGSLWCSKLLGCMLGLIIFGWVSQSEGVGRSKTWNVWWCWVLHLCVQAPHLHRWGALFIWRSLYFDIHKYSVERVSTESTVIIDIYCTFPHIFG